MSDTRATIVQLFCDRVAASGPQVAVHRKQQGEFSPVTWNELAGDVARLGRWLIDQGVGQGDRVVLVAPNRYEWIVVDLAIQLAGAVHVPVHNSSAGAQIAWQANNSEARLLIAGGDEQLARLASCGEAWPAGAACYTFDACSVQVPGHPVRQLSEMLPPLDLADALAWIAGRREAVGPDALATILYTSGTTGEPKGVMLSQHNLASNALAALAAFETSADDLRLGWLPLSHIFARTCDLYTVIASGCQMAISLDPLEVIGDCQQLRPTLLNGVPYFFEKVQNKLIDAGVADQPGILPQLLGGRMRAICSGGAALPEHVERFFNERGTLLVQGYGLTETSPVISVGTRERHKIGTVGPAIPGVEVRIAADGEILTRGPHVMLGYWKRPDATNQAIVDGWFHTGDLGELDAEGFLRITGRKKELIVTSGGKNVAPVLIESLLVADPLIQQALVVGDGRKFLTALLVPNRAALEPLAQQHGLDTSSWPELLCHPQVQAWYRQCIDQRLATVSAYEQVGKFALLEREFSIDQGELTPSFKLRRQVVLEHFQSRIDAMYQS